MSATAKDTVTDISPTPKTIYGKLLAARQAFHAQKLTKTGVNTFSNYQYFEMEDFVPQAMECTAAQGLLPLVSFSTEYATMTVVDVETEASIVITSPMSTAKLKACHEVQNLGAVEKYERRYLWAVLMELLENDQIEPQKAVSEPATPEQIASMYEYSEAGLMTEGQRMWLEKASDRITKDQAEYVLERLREKEDSQDD